MKKVIIIIGFIFLSVNIFSSANEPKVETGADLLFTKYFKYIKGKRLGLITNPTSVLSDGRHLADALYENKNVEVTALFGPEHGIRADTTGSIENSIDTKTGIPIYSLYGKTYKPTPDMMKNIDILIFDIQDVGARFYTFISTLGFAMEAAAEKGIPFIVLDHPNPIRGLYVDGPVALDSMESFVAYAPIPIAYGMTIGELAQMYNEEGWLHNGRKCNLIIAKMEGWTRNLWYDQTELKWIKPSPNMVSLSTAVVYPGTCLFEGTNVSEGRGTDKPFEYIGAPWLNAAKEADELNNYHLKGVRFEAIKVTPVRTASNATSPKYLNQKCNDIYVHITDRNIFKPVEAAIYLLWEIKKDNPENFEWREKAFDRLCGTPEVRLMLDDGKTPKEIISSWQKDLNKFKKIRSGYLLYN
ncbi:MAG: DUF1343 domain-containing protein [Ignavibacteriaceae bacterium]